MSSNSKLDHAAMNSVFENEDLCGLWCRIEMGIPLVSIKSQFTNTVGMVHFASSMGCRFKSSLCEVAAKRGLWDIVKWTQLQSPPYILRERICEIAAANGLLEELQWLRSLNPPCPWDGKTCMSAGRGGHLSVLKWLRDQPHPRPWDAR
eukprot:CAMPEP_0114483588 /NCGR_PEP_ID=MMETSP0104-20121206/18956_1 /TAXON_ID=37642 ORGANISM="Paraphysomonas imperforata, Strain PA2" /NCGR_SAMPLE_ID=MMETSP0104 /ASSEMBLY_ACC=CAM_ASM_000202 /LENGTH=148 /DNA_ID=CAMNT_0001659571 /DNA_START=66 /DNA_END=510 /DNA_ORIENTATION=-